MKRIEFKVLISVLGFLFSFSILFPFFTINSYGYYSQDRSAVAFWSFRDVHSYLPYGSSYASSNEQYLFFDFWGDVRGDYGGVWEGVAVLMFVAEVLTILSVIGMVLLGRFGAFWALLAGIYSAVSVACMAVFSTVKPVSVYSSSRLEAGFWLTLVASVLFFLGFALAEWKSQRWHYDP